MNSYIALPWYLVGLAVTVLLSVLGFSWNIWRDAKDMGKQVGKTIEDEVCKQFEGLRALIVSVETQLGAVRTSQESSRADFDRRLSALKDGIGDVEKDLLRLRVELAQQYVQKEDHDRNLGRIFRKIEEIQKELSSIARGEH